MRLPLLEHFRCNSEVVRIKLRTYVTHLVYAFGLYLVGDRCRVITLRPKPLQHVLAGKDIRPVNRIDLEVTEVHVNMVETSIPGQGIKRVIDQPETMCPVVTGRA